MQPEANSLAANTLAANTLAEYACQPNASRGRHVNENESAYRSPFQRDRDRIIHSTAFRRLEYKTQVFVNHEGDHFRTRLTHSLEVAQLSRSIARELGLNEDLAEALALAHDLGHPPFGHAGEEALQAAMQDFGGFDHNAQALRILTKLEQKYAAFDGLNLTWEALEGIAKHNGPVSNPPRALRDVALMIDLELGSYASLEAQIASLCDDIAYIAHDVEDGLRAGLLTLESVHDAPLPKTYLGAVLKEYPGLAESRLIHESKRAMINAMCMDLVKHTRAALVENGIRSVSQVRQFGKPLAQFSAQMDADMKATKRFLFNQMYRHYKVNRMTSKARRIVAELFEFFLHEPECLPTIWREKTTGANTQGTAELVADYLAGMTDRFAVEEHKRIFDLSYKIIGL